MSAPQGSQEWREERAGHCTASQFKAVLAKIKTGEAAARRNYRWQLATERLTGIPVSSGFESAAMRWGTEKEPFAGLSYEMRTGNPVVKTGFLRHPAIKWCGASPDGLVDDDGVTEFKCPEPMTHLEWLEAGVVPSEHVPQCQGVMAVTGRKWCDFTSYDPRFPEHLQLFIVRVPRDDTYIANLEKEIRKFLAEVDELCDRLMNTTLRIAA